MRLISYLDLESDYTGLSVDKSDTFTLSAIEYGRGIRILRQDPWETLISFIISQRNSIPRIKSTIKNLCQSYGNMVRSSFGDYILVDHAFPTPKDLAYAKLEDLDNLGLGYRSKYILSTARAIYNGDFNLDKLADPEMPSDIVVRTLQSLYGVGQKVANCVALFGLHRLDTFPIDVWIQRIIDEEYDGQIDINQFGSLSGLIQQYWFYYKRSMGGK